MPSDETEMKSIGHLREMAETLKHLNSEEERRCRRVGRIGSTRVEDALAEAFDGPIEEADDDGAIRLGHELKTLMDGHDPGTIAKALIAATNHSLQHHPEALAHLMSWLGTILDCELLDREQRDA